MESRIQTWDTLSPSLLLALKLPEAVAARKLAQPPKSRAEEASQRQGQYTQQWSSTRSSGLAAVGIVLSIIWLGSWSVHAQTALALILGGAISITATRIVSATFRLPRWLRYCITLVTLFAFHPAWSYLCMIGYDEASPRSSDLKLFLEPWEQFNSVLREGAFDGILVPRDLQLQACKLQNWRCTAERYTPNSIDMKLHRLQHASSKLYRKCNLLACDGTTLVTQQYFFADRTIRLDQLHELNLALFQASATLDELQRVYIATFDSVTEAGIALLNLVVETNDLSENTRNMFAYYVQTPANQRGISRLGRPSWHISHYLFSHLNHHVGLQDLPTNDIADYFETLSDLAARAKPALDSIDASFKLLRERADQFRKTHKHLQPWVVRELEDLGSMAGGYIHRARNLRRDVLMIHDAVDTVLQWLDSENPDKIPFADARERQTAAKEARLLRGFQRRAGLDIRRAIYDN